MRVLLTLVLLVTALPRATGQDAALGALSVHHGFPLAGAELRVLVEGFEPGGPVLLRPGAPPEGLAPSFAELLGDGARFTPVPGGFATRADDAGVLELLLPLRGGDDVGRRIEFLVEDGLGGVAPVSLLVHPPTALLAVEGGLVRVDLTRGEPLGGLLPGSGALRGAGLEVDGLHAWLLRERGRLENVSLLRWGDPPLSVRRLPRAGEALAHSARAGAAFVLSGLEGGVLGRLHFVGGDWGSLPLEALESRPGHRPWAISLDGERAFVAEDELLVREIDLRHGALGALFTAGVPGDTAIADMLVQDEQLLVLTRRDGGRPGSLTRFDLAAGRVSTHLLDVDPLRLVDLGDGVALVIPAQGATLTLLDGGLPGVPRVLADTGQLRDAAPVAGGALLLLVQPDGARELLQLDPRSLRVAPVPASAPWPAVERVLGAGGPAALLLDEASGAVLRLEPSTGALAPLPGLRREPQAPVVLLP